MKPTNAQLRQFITTYFNDSELESFCFDYFPEVKYTRGMEFSYKVEQLIGYCQRRDLEANLLANLQQERPQPFAAHFSAKVETPPVVATKPRNPRQIFISHAHEDAELAQRLAHDLEAEGWPVWIAPDSIRPGEKWASAISRGLDESGIFVLLLTPHAVQSRWVRSETDVAIEMEHDGEMRFVPLLVEACPIPALWRAYQRIPFRGGYDQGLRQLLVALQPEENKPPRVAGVILSDFATAEVVEVKIPPLSGQSLTEPEGGTVVRPPTAEVSETSKDSEVDEKPRKPLRPTRFKRDSFIHEKTGLEFVRVPAGEFLYGENKEKKELPEFWISKAPVTNAVYARFVQMKGYNSPSYWIDNIPPADKLDHPVVNVSWQDAKKFCESFGLQLPTEEQWEKAARGTDGRMYPWGDEQPTRDLCNFGVNEGGTTPAGKYSPQGDSPYGCVDMSGNVWEWTGSLYRKGEDRRVLRGGSWNGNRNNARAAARNGNSPDDRVNNFGFRVVVRRPPSHHDH